MAARGLMATLALCGGAGALRRAGHARGAEPGRGARVRRRMWVAVEDAEIAVAHAETRDAPVAELPAVCRSLRTVAGEIDSLFRLERRLPPGSSRGECAHRWPR